MSADVDPGARVLESFSAAVREASATGQAIRFRGGGSKDFYGEPAAGELLDTRAYSGIVAYDPTELVISARCGTLLAEIEAALAERRQMLAFEPPHFGEATFGGMVAAGLSGPRRASAGAVRDFVLGASVMDAQGRVLRFGGQVMKNVAGYDLSRLMAGSLGTLALILEVSVKTLPCPVAEATLRLELPEDKALEALNTWIAGRLPVSASVWRGGELAVRLSGAASAVNEAREIIGGEDPGDEQAARSWREIKDHADAFFRGERPLWRISVPSITPPAALDGMAGERLVEWNGALRWIGTDAPARALREAAAKAGGHATLFRGSEEQRRAAGVFQPLSPVLMKIHRELKARFDPKGIFNPGRMYPGL